MSAVSLQGVRKTFGRIVAVDRVDLELPAGQFVGLIGHNGAGKSTTLSMLMGLFKPTEGLIRVCGLDVIEQARAAREHMGAVPEQPAVFEFLTAREMFELVAEVRGRGDVGQAVELSGLGADVDRLIREYSQGMRRRTAVAAALIGAPEVVVLDEALNGLDPPAAAAVKGALRRHVEGGGTVILSTHVVETVATLADRVVMMAHGRIVYDELASRMGAGELEELFLERMRGHKESGAAP